MDLFTCVEGVVDGSKDTTSDPMFSIMTVDGIALALCVSCCPTGTVIHNDGPCCAGWGVSLWGDVLTVYVKSCHALFTQGSVVLPGYWSMAERRKRLPIPLGNNECDGSGSLIDSWCCCCVNVASYAVCFYLQHVQPCCCFKSSMILAVFVFHNIKTVNGNNAVQLFHTNGIQVNHPFLVAVEDMMVI